MLLFCDRNHLCHFLCTEQITTLEITRLITLLDEDPLAPRLHDILATTPLLNGQLLHVGTGALREHDLCISKKNKFQNELCFHVKVG